MYWNVVDFRPVAPRTLAVQFADGLSGTIRIEPSFCSGVFEALIEDEAICTARVENGAVTWPNGLDLAPDTMYREIQRDSARRYVLTG